MKTKEDAIKKLIERAQKDAEFFHKLVFEPESALAEVDDLDRRTKGRIVAVDPKNLVAGLAGALVNLDDSVAACGSSCHDSCDATCDGSCGATCATSCDRTCGSRSCDTTTNLVSRTEFINPAERFADFAGFRRFSRF